MSVFLLFAIVEAKTISEELISRKEEALDTDYVVTATSLLTNGIQPGNVLFIDIRNLKAFNELHIPGAINIPLHFIKTKTYLMSSPLVLVDQGLSTYRLSSACKNLKEKGFDVRILDGGLDAWVGNGGAIVGDVARQMNIGRVSSADFFKEKNFHTRIVCDVSVTRSESSFRLMPYAIHLPLGKSQKEQSARIVKFQKAYSRNGANTIIVVNTDGKKYRRAKQVIDRVGCKNVFYLEGGVSAYEAYLHGLQRSWRSPTDRLVSNDPCRKCAGSIFR